MRALFLCGFHPTHDAVSSGPKIVAREIDSLAAKGWNIGTVSFENELDRRHYKEGFRQPDSGDSRLFRLTRRDRIAAALRHPLLPCAASVRPYVARQWVERLLNTHEYDRIQVEFIQAAELLPREYWPKARLVSHDILSQLYGRRYSHAAGWRKLPSWAELKRVERWEKDVLSTFGSVTVLNDKDRDLVYQLTGRSDVSVRYPEVPRYIDPSERTPACVNPTIILYWGHMGRQENVDAVHYFVENIMPRVLCDRADARLVVAGIDPPDSIRALTKTGFVEVTGFVEDPAALFRSAAVGVVPVRLGAGIKIKTLEMINCGVPVVATSVGAEGVRDSDLLTRTDDEVVFAETVVRRLSEASSMRPTVHLHE
jgi:glycosyltransferase involved in cell wall biosynthesis